MGIEIAIIGLTLFSISIISISYKIELKRGKKNVKFNKKNNEYSEIRI